MTVQFTVQNIEQRLYFLKNNEDLLILLLTPPEKIISLCIYTHFISIIYITADTERKQAIKESNIIITFNICIYGSYILLLPLFLNMNANYYI